MDTRRSPAASHSTRGDAEGSREQSRRYRRIYDVVRQIPPGTVASYGQIAALAGYPGHARQVGYALHHLEADSDVPWHRVVNARGGISARASSGSEGLQRAMLEAEGVRFDAADHVSLRRFGWCP